MTSSSRGASKRRPITIAWLIIAICFALMLLRMTSADAAPILTINGFSPTVSGSSAFVPVEHTSTPVVFTLTLPTSGASPVSGYICAVDGSGNPCKHLTVPASGSVKAVIGWQAPSAIAATLVQLKFCPNDGAADCKPSAVNSMSTPVAAQYTIALSSYTIHHTRAIHNDTVAITLLGGDFTSTPVCGGAATPSCVTGALEGNRNNGTYAVTNASIGPFTLVPGQKDALRFGYAVFNFGAGYSTTKYNQLSASVDRILTGALIEQITFGDTALVASPSYTEQINHLGWSGCDGPLAVDLIGFYDQTKLLATTSATGKYLVASPAYHFKSQTGCGSSPDYNVQYAVTRTSWRAATGGGS